MNPESFRGLLRNVASARKREWGIGHEKLGRAAIALVVDNRDNHYAEVFAKEPLETVLGTFKLNERGQQIGYRYVATQWQGGQSVIVGGGPASANRPAVWPKPKWS